MADRPSSVDRLPDEVRAEIGRLRQNGRTLDEILAHLRTMDGIAPVSRSALGRHIQGLAQVGARMRQSRQVAEALVHEMGDAPESKSAQLNIELMHSAVMSLFMQEPGADGEDGAPADPKSIRDAAAALKDLAQASKSNQDVVAAAEKRVAERTRREAAEQVETVAKDRGMSRDLVEAIKAGIFGVKAEAAAP